MTPAKSRPTFISQAADDYFHGVEDVLDGYSSDIESLLTTDSGDWDDPKDHKASKWSKVSDTLQKLGEATLGLERAHNALTDKVHGAAECQDDKFDEINRSIQIISIKIRGNDSLEDRSSLWEFMSIITDKVSDSHGENHHQIHPNHQRRSQAHAHSSYLAHSRSND